MKRRSSHSFAANTYRRFPSVSIFRPDLEAIVAVLQAEEPSSIVIQDPDYEYASLTELFEQYRGREIHELIILAYFASGYSESIMITLSRTGVSVLHQTTPKLMALLIRLEGFFKTHRRRSTSIILHPFFCLLGLAILFFLVAKLVSITIGDRFVLGAAVAAILGWVFHHDRVGGFSRIFSINRYEQESFWARNRDTLVVAIISSIVSAGLGFFVAYILFKGGISNLAFS